LKSIQIAVRVLLRQPAFTLTSILLLALGIGANTTMFSIVDSVLLRPLPYRDPERLYSIFNKNDQKRIKDDTFSQGDFVELAEQATSFSDLVGAVRLQATVTGRGEAQRVVANVVSPPYFEALGVSPILGRSFVPDEGTKGRDNVALLQESYWRRQFGGDPSVIGKSFTIESESVTILGVVPDRRGQPNEVDMYLPLVTGSEERADHRSRVLSVTGRLKDGVSERQAAQELTAISQRLAAAHPAEDAGWQIYMLPALKEVQKDSREPLLILSAAVGFVLLITCTNLANLVLVRSSGRRKEAAIRSALGASQTRVFLQSLTESVLLAVAGGAAGLLVAWWSLRAILTWGILNLPRLEQASLDVNTLIFTFLISLATGVAFGFIPAWQTLRMNLANALRDETRGSSGGLQQALVRSILVVTQVALSVILLVSAGLLLQTFRRLDRIDPGFRTENILTMRTTLALAKFSTPTARANYVQRALSAIRDVPGVQAAGMVIIAPMLNASWTADFMADGGTAAGAQWETSHYNTISPHYFETIGARILRGRDFQETDDAAHPGVVIVSEEFQRRYFPNEDPIGRSISLRFDKHDFRAQIVGVVSNICHGKLESAPLAMLYQPHAQNGWPFVMFVVKTAPGLPSSQAQILRALHDLDPDQPYEKVQPLTRLLDAVLAQRKLAFTLLSTFSALAVVLATVGLYGMLAVAVSQRAREIGIRMALGASSTAVLRLVMLQGLALTLAGLAAGLIAAPLATRTMKHMLYGVQPLDWPTLAGAFLLILVTSSLACLVPALRASRVNPGSALRAD
jgi:putative ABC transport system permease protein